MRARAYVSRMCLSALFSKYVAFRQLVPVRESFVGSEYASVRERMCASVTSPGVQDVKKKAFTDVGDNHEKPVYF